MKKRHWPVSIIILMIILLGCGTGKRPKTRFNGKIKSVTGHAMICKATASQWKKLQSTEKIDFGDSISTDSGSSVAVGFGDSNSITIGEHSKIALTAVTDSNGAACIEVFNVYGDVLSQVHTEAEKKPRYRVRTPSATADIDGTLFWVSFRLQTGTTQVNVLAGNVRVRNPRLKSRKVVIVPPGHFAFIAWGQYPGMPKKLNYGQWKKMHRVLPPGQYKKFGRKFNIGKPHNVKSRHHSTRLHSTQGTRKLKPFKRAVKGHQKGAAHKKKGLSPDKKIKRGGGKGKGKK